MTPGIEKAFKASGLPAAERAVARKDSARIVFPVAEVGTVADVARAVRHVRMLTDPAREDQAAMEAFEGQSLACEQVGSMSGITARLTNEGAAAAMTVLQRKVAVRKEKGDLAREQQLPEGMDPETWTGSRRSTDLHRHLFGVAFTETFTGLLDDNQVGTHHGIPPHVTVTVDPTTVAVRPLAFAPGSAVTDPATCTASLVDLLREQSREVLYVGRAERTESPRLRKALEARDRHRLPEPPRARPPVPGAPWARVGARRGTDLDNCVVLRVRHHHAVHADGWAITRAVGIPPGGPGSGSSPHPIENADPDDQGAPITRPRDWTDRCRCEPGPNRAAGLRCAWGPRRGRGPARW